MPVPNNPPTSMNTGHAGANQDLSITGVIGTLGTSDTAGTALPLPVGVQKDTGAMYVWLAGTDVSIGGGAGGGSMVNVVTGTQQTLGTVGTILGIGGTVTVTGGGGTLVSIQNGTINQLQPGTGVTSLGKAMANTIGTTDVGVPALYIQTATLGTAGSVTDGQYFASRVDAVGAAWQNMAYKLDSTNDSITAIMPSGTITTGTLGIVSFVNNLTSGSVRMTIGTLTTGTLQNLVTGTINALASGTITTGTVSVTTGTLSPIPTIGQSTFGTIGTTGATVFGTLAGGTSSGAGTEIFVTSVSLSMPSTAGSQDISVGFGTNAGTFHAGTGRLVRANFPAGGGIQKTFSPPINSGTNAQLCYFQAGAGTVEIDVTFFVTPSTL